jgi:myosin heavy subunit
MTKVFFKTGQLAHIEELHEKRISEMIVVAQAGIRGFLARRILIRHRSQGQAALVISGISGNGPTGT